MNPQEVTGICGIAGREVAGRSQSMKLAMKENG